MHYSIATRTTRIMASSTDAKATQKQCVVFDSSKINVMEELSFIHTQLGKKSLGVDSISKSTPR